MTDQKDLDAAIRTLKATTLATKAVAACILSNQKFSFSAVVSTIGTWMDPDDPEFEVIAVEASEHVRDILDGARILAGVPPARERN